MIFVTTGTVNYRFNRLVNGTKNLWLKQNQKIIIQHGCTPVKWSAPHVRFVQYVSPIEIMDLYSSADIVIAAAGEASVFQILNLSKNKPVLFPRLYHHNEHVDDQQLQVAQIAAKRNWAYLVTHTTQLNRVITKPIAPNIVSKSFASHSSTNLIKSLEMFITSKF